MFLYPRADCGDAEAGPSGSHSNAGGSLSGSKKAERPSQRAACPTSVNFGGFQIDPAHAVGAPSRGLPEHTAERETIHPSFGSGQRQHPPRDDHAKPSLASTSREDGVFETPSGQTHDHSAGNEATEASSGTSGSIHLAGLPGSQDLGREQADALSQVGSSQKESPTDKGDPLGHRPGHEADPRNPTSHGRPAGDTSISLLGQTTQGLESSRSGTSLAMDHQQPGESGTMAFSLQALLSQRLATCDGSPEASTLESFTIGSNFDEARSTVTPKAVRILMNPTGCICFANSFFVGLSWLTLCCDTLSSTQWGDGFALLEMLTLLSPVPVDLSTTPAFLDLLRGDWTNVSLFHQQDMIEFSDFMLSVMRPRFVNGAWATRPVLESDLQDTHLPAEKGLQHSVLRLALPPNCAMSLSIGELISHWHDNQGLCRLLQEAPPALCIAIERTCTDTRLKLHHAVYVHDSMLLPCYDFEMQSTILQKYTVVGITFHKGETLQSGHYQTGLRVKGQWFLYDDGVPPKIQSVLPSEIWQQIVFIWLTRPTSSSGGPSASASAP